MRIYDITVGISPDLPVWPGDPPVKVKELQSIGKGDKVNVSSLSLGVHAGTHIDAPLHFFEDSASVDQLGLKVLTGRAYVVDLPKAKVIDAHTLEAAGVPPRTKRVLFKTRNSKFWARGETEFQKDYVAIAPEGARWLVQKGVQVVGVDYLSVAPYADPEPTHRILLESDVVIVEGLNLSGVSQGRYTLYCLPLKVLGAEAAPARAILVGV